MTSSATDFARWTRIPARIAIPVDRGTVTSIGSHGSTSTPCNHAAVSPEKTALDGRRARAAASVAMGVCSRPDQTYIPLATRLQLAPRRCHRSTPTLRASATVKGPRVNAGGGTALRTIRVRMSAPPSLHNRSDVKPRTQPYMPVLRDHHAGGHAMADQHATMKRRVDHVTDDHAVARSSDRLDATRDVDAGVQPHRARGAGSQRRAVAVAPLTAETQAVRRPSGQGKLKNIRRVGDRRGWRRRRRDAGLRGRKEDPP